MSAMRLPILCMFMRSFKLDKEIVQLGPVFLREGEFAVFAREDVLYRSQ